MKKKRFSVEQMIGELKQAEVEVPVAEVIRKAGISDQTFYRWKAKYAGLEVDQVRQMAQLQEENLRLKQLVAELTLDKTMLQDVLPKNCDAFAAWASREKDSKPLGTIPTRSNHWVFDMRRPCQWACALPPAGACG